MYINQHNDDQNDQTITNSRNILFHKTIYKIRLTNPIIIMNQETSNRVLNHVLHVFSLHVGQINEMQNPHMQKIQRTTSTQNRQIVKVRNVSIF